MQGKIKLLSDDCIQKIAAGEVIERPSNVVKELLENSADAGSSTISLEIKAAGKELIRIADNGCGILKEEVPLALQKHSTSKIQSLEDLQTLTTFGFRGEALPCIASISKMELITRSKEENSGSQTTLVGGKIIAQKECGRSEGTTVEVKELFFNTPARLKFLKSDSAEKNKMLRTFEESALSHPEIAYELKNENSSKELPSRKDLKDRILDLWGEHLKIEDLIPLNLTHPFIQIKGWISNPQSHKPTKSYQIFYINKRPIISRALNHALYEAYRDCLPQGRHPVGIISITMDPSQVDFNVHPTKREVKFRNESQIYDLLIKEIRLKRSLISTTPSLFKKELGVNDLQSSFQTNQNHFENIETFSGAHPNFKESIGFLEKHNFSGSASEAATSTLLIKQPTKVLAQFHSLYILAEQDHHLIIIDQHAAAERILYEKFKQCLSKGLPVPTQVLLLPLLWNLSLPQAELVRGTLESLRKLGFFIEEFGEKTFRIQEAPAMIPESELQKSLDEILSSLEKEQEPNYTVEEKIMHAACRSAIKANQTLSHPELSKLLAELELCGNRHTCPHGRPITLTISKQELDKKFGRT
ncbi:MAG: DNA mismatch repair endonuclease MutL [Elusimicrobia bacterium]|nr:DNA mismatch repair endonuclease MutL [Elusimicrobiota bacterium]